MIVVTGATGKLGAQIVELLLDRLPADELGVSVRDPAEAAGLAARGVRVRHGDFTDPSSLADAFADADQVLLISAAIRGSGAATAHRAAIDAAHAAGAQRVLYTSHQGAAPDSLFAPTRGHWATEQYLASTGKPFTALRDGYYATTLSWIVDDALSSGVLAQPADGPVSWTAHSDLAEAAVVALTEPGRLDGVSPPLTGPQSLDLAAVAALLGDLTGRPIEHVVLEDEEWQARAVSGGMPVPAAEFTLGMFRAFRRGEFDIVDPALPELIGHPVTTVRSYLADLVGRRAEANSVGAATQR